MATASYLLMSPKVLVSLFGLLRARRRRPEPSLEPRVGQKIIDVIIPARNEEATICLALASLESQSFRPRRVLVVDDASTDRTAELARAYAAQSGLSIAVVRREEARGKTPSLKTLAYESDADGIFVLDADTVLTSDDYLEALVRTVFERPSVASASGMILPLRNKDRRNTATRSAMRRFLRFHPEAPIFHDRTFFRRYLRWTTNAYREVLYYFTQNIVYRGEIDLFGTMMNSVGCGVLYRRSHLVQALRDAEAVAGDDLTDSEDIFLGFSFVDRGYRNVQNLSVTLRSEEPGAQNAPKQIVLWSSAWFQSAYYFPQLLVSPLKSFRRFLHRRRSRGYADRRRHNEPWRQPFGHEFTEKLGRPAGWIVLFALLEKVTFPLFLGLFLYFQWWDVFGVTLVCETGLMIVMLAAFGETRRLHYIGMTMAVTPLRYGTILFDVFTISRFLVDLARPGKKHWRK